MLEELAIADHEGILRMHSTRPDDVHAFLCRKLARHRIADCTSPTIDAVICLAELDEIKLLDLRYGADVEINASVDDDHLLVHAALSGSTPMRIRGEPFMLHPRTMLISGPSSAVQVSMKTDSRHVAVRMPLSICTHYLQEQLHIPLSGPLHFTETCGSVPELPEIWLASLGHIAAQMQRTPQLANTRRIHQRYGFVLAELLLGSCQHTYSAEMTLPSDHAMPRHIRKAIEVINDCHEGTITISALASHVGVSPRTLQIGFKRYVGTSPQDYIRNYRIELLHQALRSAPANETVTDLMLANGIVNFGRYARYYRQRYGCTPSETLRRRN